MNLLHLQLDSKISLLLFIFSYLCFCFFYCLIPAEISLVICDKNSKMKNLLRRKSSMKCLKTIVCIESPDSESINMAEANNVKLIAFQELVVSWRHFLLLPLPILFFLLSLLLLHYLTFFFHILF